MVSDNKQLVALRSTIDKQCDEIKQLKIVERCLRNNLKEKIDENLNMAAKIAVKEKIIGYRNVRSLIIFEKISMISTYH